MGKLRKFMQPGYYARQITGAVDPQIRRNYLFKSGILPTLLHDINLKHLDLAKENRHILSIRIERKMVRGKGRTMAEYSAYAQTD